jgi:LPXTG-motif cell wall-anchored protein
MMHPGLARFAVAAGAVMVGAFVAAGPAAATGSTDPQAEVGIVQLKLPKVPLAAKDFNPKGCEGIPGGAKAGTDGWVLNQPVAGATGYGYILGLVSADLKPVVVAVDKDGVVGLEVDAAELQSLKAGRLSKEQAKSLAKATAGAEPSDVKEVPAPAGVAGGVTDKGLGWLQTPAGWQIAGGALLYGPVVEGAPAEFTLARVCEAPANPSPSKAPGTGGGSGELPVTGANVPVVIGIGVLLVGAGVALLVLRRRRDPKFVA